MAYLFTIQVLERKMKLKVTAGSVAESMQYLKRDLSRRLPDTQWQLINQTLSLSSKRPGTIEVIH